MLFRSAFWLGVGYLVVQSGHVDVGQTASELSASVTALGKRMVVEQMLADECDTVECHVILAAMLTSKSSTEPPGSELQRDIILTPRVPAPPPRPDWAG